MREKEEIADGRLISDADLATLVERGIEPRAIDFLLKEGLTPGHIGLLFSIARTNVFRDRNQPFGIGIR